MSLVILDEKRRTGKMYYLFGGMIIGVLVTITMDFGIRSLCAIVLFAILWALLGIKIEKEYRRAIK